MQECRIAEILKCKKTRKNEKETVRNRKKQKEIERNRKKQKERESDGNRKKEIEKKKYEGGEHRETIVRLIMVQTKKKKKFK